MFDIFVREFSPGPEARVADFGVSGHRDHPAHYFFESLYPHRQSLTVIGRVAEGALWFPEAFPGLKFIEADLRSVPFPDGYFEAGLCNAVVEHAGSRDEQAALVREVCRVCRNVMFTTPNKWFPIELHTFVPFIHWLPDRVYRILLTSMGLGYFADVHNLNLLDSASFLELFPHDRENRLIEVGLPFLATNLVCLSRKRGDKFGP
jgi:hypothetical protein